jgi:Icc-related predicted phosphoesterase
MQAALHKADYKRILHCEASGERLRPWHTAAIHESTRNYIRRTLSTPFSGKTVVMTHHAVLHDTAQAGFETLPTQPSYVSDLSDLLLKYQPALSLHGHIHAKEERMVGRTKVACNPRGFAHENSGFVWDYVHEI